MKNIAALFLFFFVSVQFCFAQSENQSDIKTDTLTTEENLNWLEDFKKLESEVEKIQAIKDKIVFDSAYTPQVYYKGCGMIIRITDTTKTEFVEEASEFLNKKISESKIFFILNNYPLNDKGNETYQYLSLLNENTVSEINIFEGNIASAIWGSRGANGVIHIIVKKRKIRKKIKQIQKEQAQKNTKL